METRDPMPDLLNKNLRFNSILGASEAHSSLRGTGLGQGFSFMAAYWNRLGSF